MRGIANSWTFHSLGFALCQHRHKSPPRLDSRKLPKLARDIMQKRGWQLKDVPKKAKEKLSSAIRKLAISAVEWAQEQCYIPSQIETTSAAAASSMTFTRYVTGFIAFMRCLLPYCCSYSTPTNVSVTTDLARYKTRTRGRSRAIWWHCIDSRTTLQTVMVSALRKRKSKRMR